MRGTHVGVVYMYVREVWVHDFNTEGFKDFFLARFLPWTNMHNIKARLWCMYMYARTCVGVCMCICFGVLILLCTIQRKKNNPQSYVILHVKQKGCNICIETYGKLNIRAL